MNWRSVISLGIALVAAPYLIRQVRRPTRWVGRFFAWNMNLSHSALTDWGLTHVRIGSADTILDVGCGGGRTVQKLAAVAQQGRVVGADFAAGSVAAARATNAEAIRAGRVEIVETPVSRLSFPDATFDLVTAVETHYYWPDPAGDLREVMRVTKPGGVVLVVAESYAGTVRGLIESLPMKLLGARQMTAKQHCEWFKSAGFEDVQMFEDRSRGWICVSGRRPPD